MTITPEMIAPCGMNCEICHGHLRERKPCAGCHGEDSRKPHHCVVCLIKNCEMINAFDPGYCYECGQFPCARLKKLDKRYRTKYGMSMISNLENIRDFGMEKFLEQERKRWTCPGCGQTICVHRDACIFCGQLRIFMGPRPTRPTQSK